MSLLVCYDIDRLFDDMLNSCLRDLLGSARSRRRRRNSSSSSGSPFLFCSRGLFCFRFLFQLPFVQAALFLLASRGDGADRVGGDRSLRGGRWRRVFLLLFLLQFCPIPFFIFIFCSLRFFQRLVFLFVSVAFLLVRTSLLLCFLDLLLLFL